MRVRRPTPQTAIVSRAAQRKIEARTRESQTARALKEWPVPPHVAEAQRYVIIEDSDDVEIIR